LERGEKETEFIIEFTSKATRELVKLEKGITERVAKKIELLSKKTIIWQSLKRPTEK
jgi:mRNA-degrading endonuclease RelE of RelBE toxin-antitoxin system